MGLVPGVILTVISNSGRGPVVISLQGSRIGLGRGMAGHIWGCVCS
jgi:Fe2+ transport system protein FeoA